MNSKPQQSNNLKRIAVVGTSCCGKTTFARRLSEKLGIKHVELDAEFWLPGWKQTPIEEFRPKVESIIAGDEWIIDGNYYNVQSIIFARATNVIWLDLSFSRILFRGLDRTIRRVVTQEELYNDNRESFRQSFLSKDSILLWILKSFPRNKKRYGPMRRKTQPDAPELIRLTQPKQVERFLKEL